MLNHATLVKKYNKRLISGTRGWLLFPLLSEHFIDVDAVIAQVANCCLVISISLNGPWKFIYENTNCSTINHLPYTPISDFRESPLRKAKNTRTIVNDDVDGRSTVLQLSMFWLRREARFGSRDPWRSAFCDTTKIIVWSLRHAQVAMLRDTLKSRREAVLRYGVEIWCDCHKGDDLFWFLWVFTFF